GSTGTFTYKVTPGTGVGKLTGTAALKVQGVSFDVKLGATDTDGWNYTAGITDSTTMRSATAFTLGGVDFGSTDLTIKKYAATSGSWEVTGKAKFGTGNGIFEDAIPVTIGTGTAGSGWIASASTMQQMQFRIDEGLKIAGVSFKTDTTSGLTVKYSETTTKKTFELTGGATVELGEIKFGVVFATDRINGTVPKWTIDKTNNTVSQSNAVAQAQRLPGLVIENGALKRLDVMVNAEFSLMSAKIYARDLHFTYNSANKRMTFSGVAAALIDGFNDNPQVLSYMTGGTTGSMTKGLMIEFGDNGSPGIELVGTDLRTLDVAVSGTFFKDSVFINAENLRFTWKKVASGNNNFTRTFSMSGSANVRILTADGAALVGVATDGQAKGFGVQFGYTDDKTKITSPGLVITNGKLDKLDMKVSTSFELDIKTPVPVKVSFELKELRFQWDRDYDTTKAGEQSRFNLTGSAKVVVEVVAVEVQFGSDDGKTPGLTLTDGKLEYLDMTVTSNMEFEGIKLPGSSIKLGAIFSAKTGTFSFWGTGKVGLAVPKELLGQSGIYKDATATIGGGSRANALAALTDTSKNGFIVQGKKLKRFSFEVTNFAAGLISGGNLNVSYNYADKRVEFSGQASTFFAFDTANLSIGTKNDPGIIIVNGNLTKFSGTASVTSNLSGLTWKGSVSANLKSGYLEVSGKETVGLAIPIPAAYRMLIGNVDSKTVSLANTESLFRINLKNPKSDDSYLTFSANLVDKLPVITIKVKLGDTATVLPDFSTWDNALKEAAKKAAEEAKKLADEAAQKAADAAKKLADAAKQKAEAAKQAAKKVWSRLGPIDGAMAYYDASGTSLAGAVVSYDPATQPHTTTAANGEFTLGLPEGTTTGRMVMVGGIDTSTAVPNRLVLVAPVSSAVMSPFTTLQTGIVDGSSRDEATAAARVKLGLGLPEQFDVNAADYLSVALEGVAPAAAVFASDVEIVSLVSMTAASLDGLTNGAGGRPTQQSLGIHAFAALADMVDSAAGSSVPLDLTSESTAQAMISATATRAGIDLASASRQSNSASAARVIAAIVAKVGAVSIPVSGDLVEMGAALKAIVKPQIVATGVASEQLAAVNAGTATAADVEASYTGAALDTLVAAQIVGNLEAPKVSFNDPVVVVGPDGSGTATFEVSVTGDPSPLLPISIGYATADYTATVADGDYDARSGTLVWAAGDAPTKSVTVPVHAGTSLDPRQFFILKASSATNAIVLYSGVGEIKQAPVATITALAVSTLDGTPRNTTVLKATVVRDSATHIGYAGSVTFKDGDTVLGTVDVDTAGEATWRSSLITIGEHRFSAVYNGVSTMGYEYLASQATPITALVGTPQTLSVTALADVTWGAASTMRQVFASSSLGIPVTYAVTGPATIDADGLLEVTGLGHVVVTVSQPGDDYIFAATPVTVAFDVLRPKLTVRIDDQTATYGDNLSTLALSYSISGFLGSDTESSLAGLPVLSIPQGALHAGSYAITATTATDSFYDFAYEPGTLTVAKASLVILVNDASVAYGSPIPTLTFAAEGFVNGETLAALSSQPILKTAAAGGDAGDYSIKASGFEAADYEITTIAGTLTITPVALEIRADDLTITYG
ncbi:MAG: MBG domain-containing protein, partial [Planctomycetia bacterium]